MGDKLLKEAAKRLQSCIRSNDYAFRIGGDEFSLVVCTEFDESLCCRIKEKIQNRLCAPFDIDGKTLYVGYSIVSEGVETEEEMSLLSSWGVDMIQGYYFSRPLPVDELLKLLNM